MSATISQRRILARTRSLPVRFSNVVDARTPAIRPLIPRMPFKLRSVAGLAFAAWIVWTVCTSVAHAADTLVVQLDYVTHAWTGSVATLQTIDADGRLVFNGTQTAEQTSVDEPTPDTVSPNAGTWWITIHGPGNTSQTIGGRCQTSVTYSSNTGHYIMAVCTSFPHAPAAARVRK